LITTVIKPYRLLLLGVTASLLALSLFGCAPDVGKRQTSMMESQKDSIMNRGLWRKMSDDEKRTYARKSLEDIGENPSAFVSEGKTKESLLLQGLEAVYAK